MCPIYDVAIPGYSNQWRYCLYHCIVYRAFTVEGLDGTAIFLLSKQQITTATGCALHRNASFLPDEEPRRPLLCKFVCSFSVVFFLSGFSNLCKMNSTKIFCSGLMQPLGLNLTRIVLAIVIRSFYHEKPLTLFLYRDDQH